MINKLIKLIKSAIKISSTVECRSSVDLNEHYLNHPHEHNLDSERYNIGIFIHLAKNPRMLKK